MCCCSSSQLQDLHPCSQEPAGLCQDSCLSSLPVPRGTSGLCWIGAAAGLKESCFPAEAEGGGRTLCSWVCLWNQDSVVFSSPCFAARCLFLSLQRFPAPLSLWWGAASQKREPDVRERGAAFIRIRTRMQVFWPYRCGITGHFMLNLALSGIDFACAMLRMGEVIKHKLELNLFRIRLCVFLNSSDTEIN